MTNIKTVDGAETQSVAFDAAKIRADFPILQQTIRGKPLVYLDSAASTQKPTQVIETIDQYYRSENANIHRGVYYLSELATSKYEAARETVRRFLNAASTKEIIFTSGTTDSINLVAHSFGRAFVQEGDEIIISAMEHHSNIVPWQMLCEERGATIKVVPMNDNGELELEDFEAMFSSRTRLVALVSVSNSLGTVNPIEKMIDVAHAHDVPVLLDAAQAVAHAPLDVQASGCDFLAFSAHKIFGPTGVGVLYGKQSLLEQIPPYKGGGDMIREVTFEKTTYAELPSRFEAGTPNIAGVIGLGAALDYVESIGREQIAAYETELMAYGEARLAAVDGLRIIGTASQKAGAISFVLDDVHPHDVGTFLDRQGIAIRVGHHCTQPVMDRFNIPATSRASIAVYNNKSDYDALVDGLDEIIKVFRG